jgi:hypothetical protein
MMCNYKVEMVFRMSVYRYNYCIVVISGGKAHTNTRKLIQNILKITDVFLNQKRVNVCESASVVWGNVLISRSKVRRFKPS